MYKKYVFCLLMIGILLLGFNENITYASDAVTNGVELMELDNSETDESLDMNLILDSMEVTQQKLDSLSKELCNILALMLILVVFETLRIVRGWSKSIGVK